MIFSQRRRGAEAWSDRQVQSAGCQASCMQAWHPPGSAIGIRTEAVNPGPIRQTSAPLHLCERLLPVGPEIPRPSHRSGPADGDADSGRRTGAGSPQRPTEQSPPGAGPFSQYRSAGASCHGEWQFRTASRSAAGSTIPSARRSVGPSATRRVLSTTWPPHQRFQQRRQGRKAQVWRSA